MVAQFEEGGQMAMRDQKRRDTIAGELRAHRAKAQLTQEQVAEVCGMDKTSIGKYEQGVAGISYEAMWTLADYYGVSLDAMGGRVFQAH